MKSLLSLLVVLNMGLVFGQKEIQPLVHPSVPPACARTTGTAFVNDYTDCSGYHVCIDGIYVGSGNCPAGQFFDDGKCDLSHNVECMTCDISQPDTLLYNTVINGSCTDYALCRNLTPVRRSCPTGFVFDIDTKLCEEPGFDTVDSQIFVNCAACPVISTSSIVRNPTIDGVCDHYIVCSQSGTTITSCTSPQIVNDAGNGCVPEAQSSCGSTIGTFPEQNCRPDEVHDVPAITDCRQYHVCFFGEFIDEVRDCPGDLTFDIVSESCRLGGECWDQAPPLSS